MINKLGDEISFQRVTSSEKLNELFKSLAQQDTLFDQLLK